VHLQDLESRLKNSDSEFQMSAKKFCERDAESHDFFKTFAEFCIHLNEAKVENEKREQERRDMQRQEKLKQDRQERISRTTSKVIRHPGGGHLTFKNNTILLEALVRN
jgi:hypothetical protein